MLSEEEKIQYLILTKNMIANENIEADDIARDSEIKILVGEALQHPDSISDEYLSLIIELSSVVYTYSEKGLLLMSDKAYDMLMNEYISRGHDRLLDPTLELSEKEIYDNILKFSCRDSLIFNKSYLNAKKPKWHLIRHEDPAIVGSVEKVYTKAEFLQYIDDMRDMTNKFVIAPKYDGISASIKIVDGKIEYVATRRNGVEGLNITECIKNIPDIEERIVNIFKLSYQLIYDKEIDINELKNGFYKVEILMSLSDFLNMQKNEITIYANRRSAVSGIISTPMHIGYAKYLTIMPLLFRPIDISKKYCLYAPGYSTLSKADGCINHFKEVEKLLEFVKDKSFEYRVDGVVCFPLLDIIDEHDYMNYSLAYKVNTISSKTQICYGYVSVGKRGKSVPMLNVHPAEVNETIVSDVSLGSWDNYSSMCLHEDETVIIYSAGDVIPQAKLCDPREFPKNSKRLIIDKICPFCNNELTRINNEFWCINQQCVRIASGKISNFISKIGGLSIGDGIITNLYNEGIISDTLDLFLYSVDRLKSEKIKGWGENKIKILDNELERLKNSPIEISTFIGALGIMGISKKKSRIVFKRFDINEILSAESECELSFMISDLKGIGEINAKSFSSFIFGNKEYIKKLMDIFIIIPDKEYRGNVVFTGFRSEELEDQFESLGYGVSDTINSSTIAVINGSGRDNTESCKKARKRNIEIIDRTNVDYIIEKLKKEGNLYD